VAGHLYHTGLRGRVREREATPAVGAHGECRGGRRRLGLHVGRAVHGLHAESYAHEPRARNTEADTRRRCARGEVEAETMRKLDAATGLRPRRGRKGAHRWPRADNGIESHAADGPLRPELEFGPDACSAGRAGMPNGIHTIAVVRYHAAVRDELGIDEHFRCVEAPGLSA